MLGGLFTQPSACSRLCGHQYDSELSSGVLQQHQWVPCMNGPTSYPAYHTHALFCCHLLLPLPSPAPVPPPGEDRRACAARCLGELVRKMGERVLHRMLPILRDTMGSPDAATRQGVCTGLKEVRGLCVCRGGGTCRAYMCVFDGVSVENCGGCNKCETEAHHGQP